MRLDKINLAGLFRQNPPQPTMKPIKRPHKPLVLDRQPMRIEALRIEPQSLYEAWLLYGTPGTQPVGLMSGELLPNPPSIDLTAYYQQLFLRSARRKIPQPKIDWRKYGF